MLRSHSLSLEVCHGFTKLGADESRIETYRKRWWQWVRTGVDGVLRVGDPTQFSGELVRYFVNAQDKSGRSH